MVKYNTDAGHPIEITIGLEDNQIELQLVDFDVDPFDPTSVPEAAVDAAIQDRQPGGLGLHLVKSIVDRIAYEYDNRRMTITVSKRLES